MDKLQTPVVEGAKQVDSMLTRHGFPMVIATFLIGFLVWSQIATNKMSREITEAAATTAKEQTEAARKHSDKLVDVIVGDTAAKIEMTTAIKSLERTQNETSIALRALEMSIEKRNKD